MYFEIPETNLRLLGSMHLVPSGKQALPDWARAAYAWCEDLVIEGDPEQLLRCARASASDSLRRKLPPHTWEALRAMWPTAGPFAPLDQLHPWGALLLASVLRTQAWAIPGIEPHLLQMAADEGKSVGYLETAELVAGLLAAAPVNEIHAALDMAFDDEGMRRAMHAMHETWCRQERDAFYAVARASPMFSLAGVRRALLEARNRAWVPELERLMRSSKRTLAVVGALHLCGPGNVGQCLGRELRPVA